MPSIQNESYVPPDPYKSFAIPKRIQDEELEAIQERRTAANYKSSTDKQDKDESATDDSNLRENLVGLALSGGGIRSAIFSLGVMQRLAKEGCLERVDYLSTVSGGGYIGGSLTWFLNSGFNTTSDTFPYGVENPRKERRRDKQPKILEHLGQRGNYLTPGKGITTLSLISAFLRGLLVNCVVWLTPIIVIMVALYCASYAFVDELAYHADRLLTKMGFAAHIWDMCCKAIDDLNHSDDTKVWTRVFFFLAVATGMFYLVVNIVYLLTIRLTKSLLISLRKHEIQYPLGRKLENWLRWPLFLMLVFLVLSSLAIVEEQLETLLGVFNWGLPLLLSIVAGAWESTIHSGSKRNGKITLRIPVVLVSILLLYGVVLLSYKLALMLLALEFLGVATLILLSGILIALVTGCFVNLNYVSMHRYYRDRLMEAFMPHQNTNGRPGPAENANKMRLQDACSKHGPYHLLNTNVILVDSKDSRWRVRGGDAFLLSSKYCGSTATGWIKTPNYNTKDPLTLATAVAISAAAVNPNTGAGGKGSARNRLVSLVMVLLNISLGYWVPNPRLAKKSRNVNKVANHFRAMYHELRPHGYEENRSVLHLSDGGHFENLGVYELVRRKVKLIICCDGTADPEFRFAALQVLIRRIGADFGARIEFDIFNRLELLIPRDPDPLKVGSRDPFTDAYPAGVKFAEQGYIKGRIIYTDGTESTLILLKTTMIKGLGLLLKGYKGAHPDFPDQTTADQFFDEEQFDAYRELGYEIAKQMISGTELKQLLEEFR